MSDEVLTDGVFGEPGVGRSLGRAAPVVLAPRNMIRVAVLERSPAARPAESVRRFQEHFGTSGRRDLAKTLEVALGQPDSVRVPDQLESCRVPLNVALGQLGEMLDGLPGSFFDRKELGSEAIPQAGPKGLPLGAVLECPEAEDRMT